MKKALKNLTLTILAAICAVALGVGFYVALNGNNASFYTTQSTNIVATADESQEEDSQPQTEHVHDLYYVHPSLYTYVERCRGTDCTYENNLGGVVTVTMPQANNDDGNIYYDGQPHTITLEGTFASGYVLPVAYLDENYVDVDPVNAGVYSATIDVGKFAIAYTITIEKAPLTITAKDTTITYGDEPSCDGADGVGFVNGEDLTSAVTYTYTYDQYGDVGEYEIIPSLETNNYAVTYENGKLTVNPKEITTINWCEDDYTYNGSVQSVTANYADANSNNEPISLKVEIDKEFKDAGTYTATASFADETNNYTLPKTVTKIYTIKQKSIAGATVTLENNSFDYDGAEHSGVVESVVIDGLNATYDYETVSGTNVDEYKVTVTGNGNFTGEATATFEINLKKLTIKANNTSITYGEAPTNSGVTYTGFADGDDESSLTGELVYSYTYKQYGDAGDGYAIKVEGLTSSNYDIVFEDGKLTVDQKKLTVTIAVKDIVYTGESYNVSASYSGIVNGVSAVFDYTYYQIDNEGNTTVLKSQPTDVGTYKVVAKLNDNYENNKNYTIDGDVSATYEILPADFNPTVSIDGWTYGDEANVPTVEGNTSKGQVTYLYAVKDSEEYSEEVPQNAGEYTVKAIIAANGNYNEATATCDFAIAKKDISGATITLGDALTYDGTAQTQQVSVVFGGNDVEVEVEGNVQTNAGTYTITITATDANFTGTTTTDFTIDKLSIEKADVELGAALTYSGTEQTQEVVSVKVGELEVTGYSVSGNKATNAGTYDITITAAETGNFKGSVIKSFTIEKLSVTTENTQVVLGTDLTYNGSEQTKTVESVTVGGTVLSKDSYIISGNTHQDAGKYNLVITINDSNNYSGSIDVEYEIAKYDIGNSVNYQKIYLDKYELVYNGSEQSVKVTSVEAIEGLVLSAEDYEYSGNKQTNAGDYNVTVTVKDTCKNYKGSATVGYKITPLSIENAVVTLENALVYNGEEQEQKIASVTVDKITLTEDDYNVSDNKATKAGDATLVVTAKDGSNFTGSVNVTFTVAKAKMTIAAANKQVEYGTKLNTIVFTAEYYDYAKVDDVMANEGKIEYTCAYGTQGNLDCGDYKIEVSGYVNPNYEVTYTSGILTVVSKSVTTTLTAENKVYDGSVASVTAEDISQFEVNGDHLALTLTYKDADDQTIEAPVNAGTYTVSASINNTNYKLLCEAVEFTIAKADVNFEVAISSWTYGLYDENVNSPEVTGNLGEGKASYKYKAINASDDSYTENLPTEAGEYVVMAYTPITTNYNAGSATATFTISKRDISEKDEEGNYIADVHLIESLTYNGEEQTQDVSVIFGDKEVTVEVEGNVQTNAGIYTITITANDDNFTGTITYQFEIAAYDLTLEELEVTLGDELTYNGEEQEKAVTSVYWGQTQITSYNVTNNSQVNAGDEYYLTITFTGNYKGSTSRQFAIAKKLVTVTADSKSLTYGEDVPEYTASYSGFAGEDTVAVATNDITLSCEYAKYDGVGDYQITLSGELQADNYIFEYVNGNVEVAAKNITVTINDVRSAEGKDIVVDSYGYQITMGTLAKDTDFLNIALSTDADKDVVGSYDIVGTWANDNYNVTFVNGTYEVYSIAGYTSLLEDYGDVIALNPDEITIDDIKDIEDLIDAYNNLTDDEKAQLTDDEKAAIEALKDKAEEIAKAKENAEEKLAALEGLSAEDIDGNIEDIKQAIADAEEAVKDYTDLSSGLSSEDLEGIENIDAAKEVVDAYDESLTAANEAIAKLDGISAKDIQDGTYTREEVVALIEDATQKIEEFISNGGKLDELTNADLVSSAQGQVDIYNEYAAYIAEHGDTIALSADEIAVSDIENIAKAAEDLTKLSEEAASLISDESKSNLEALGQKAEDITSANQAAVEAIEAITGLSALDISLDGVEACTQAIDNAKKAVDDYLALSSGLSTDDISGYSAIAAAEGVVEDYNSALASAQAALDAIAGITAQSIVNGTLTQAQAQSLLTDARLKTADLDNKGGNSQALDGYSNIQALSQQLDLYSEYNTFVTDHSGILNKNINDVTYSDVAAINSMVSAYNELSASAKALLTADQIANITALEQKAISLSEAKTQADTALAALKSAIESGASTETVQSLIDIATAAVDNYLNVGGKTSDLQDYSAIEQGQRYISNEEGSRVLAIIEAGLGSIEEWTDEKIASTSSEELTSKIAVIDNALAAYDECSDEVKANLADIKDALEQLKQKMQNEIELQKIKEETIAKLLEEMNAKLADDTYSAAGRAQIEEYYNQAIENVSNHRSTEDIDQEVERYLANLDSVSPLRIGWIVGCALLCIAVIAASAYTIAMYSVNKRKHKNS